MHCNFSVEKVSSMSRLNLFGTPSLWGADGAAIETNIRMRPYGGTLIFQRSTWYSRSLYNWKHRQVDFMSKIRMLQSLSRKLLRILCTSRKSDFHSVNERQSSYRLVALKSVLSCLRNDRLEEYRLAEGVTLHALENRQCISWASVEDARSVSFLLYIHCIFSAERILFCHL